jgi:hypothetical protein
MPILSTHFTKNKKKIDPTTPSVFLRPATKHLFLSLTKYDVIRMWKIKDNK